MKRRSSGSSRRCGIATTPMLPTPGAFSRRAIPRWSWRTGASTSHAGEATAGGTRSRSCPWIVSPEGRTDEALAGGVGEKQCSFSDHHRGRQG